MNEYFSEMWNGPGRLRFFLQPVLAILLGIRDGVRDAKDGRPPYVWSVLTGTDRKQQLKHGLKQIAVPWAVGFGLSLVFQYVIRRVVHVGIAALFGAVFIAIPYMAARALSNRVYRPTMRRRRAEAS